MTSLLNHAQRLRARRFHQSGISLVAVALTMAVIGLCTVAALFYFAYGRNLFFEMFDSLKASPSLKRVTEAAPDGVRNPAPTEVRECIINGKRVYSNTDCMRAGRGTRTVDVHDTRGMEAPPTPVAPSPGAGAAQNAAAPTE